MYANEIMNDNIMPLTDMRRPNNELDRKIKKQNTRITKNNTPRTNSELFKRIRAYTGTILSFQ